MKFNAYIWNIYKESAKGSTVINNFENIGEYGSSLLDSYYPTSYDTYQSKETFLEIVELFYSYTISDIEKPSNINEAKILFESVVDQGLAGDDGDVAVFPEEYDIMLANVSQLSFALFIHAREYYIPYLFLFDFYRLKRIFDLFDIDLPPIPPKKDYRSRCLYYMDLCKVLYGFRIENNLTASELCAFLYDFAPNMLTTDDTESVNEASQVWFIGGKKNKEEESLENIFWQANPETKKGDVLVMYEKYPISAITSVWRSFADGVVDPFFHYYSNTYIGDKQNVPQISLDELKNDAYFSNHPLVRKNFQGVNGWPLTGEDYNELKRLLKDKNFDISILPNLYSPNLEYTTALNNERDVEINLIEPLLKKLGLKYERQIPLKAGRGHRVFPDYGISYDSKNNTAKVIIEAKYHLKSNRDVEDCFSQARSYANLLESQMFIICDKICLMLYMKNDSFDRDRYMKFYWDELNDSDKYQQFTKIVNSYANTSFQ